MDAKSANFLEFLKGTKQFSIPIYQRPYSWTEKQCRQLWDDIVRAGTDSAISGHFIGSIVYITEGLYQVSSINRLLVIDGQQRLTTLSLLIAALREPISKKNAGLADIPSGEVTKDEIDDYYLYNRYGRGDEHYRLILTQNDRETLLRLLDGRPLPESASNRLVQNYGFFKQQIAGSKVDSQVIYRGIAKLVIVDVALERGRDNPQLIFESLNSTGLDLSQADLIRNYILMGLPPEQQNRLYNDHWHPMEQSFGGADNVSYFDRFMRDYLTRKSESGAIPNIRDVYEVFKAHVAQTPKLDVDQRVAEIHRYSKYFVQMAFPNGQDKDISQALADINTLRVDVAYPFLLEVFDDYYCNHRLTREELIQILRLVESYVFRRAICEIPTNSLNKTFATLTRSKTFSKDRYLESVQATLLNKDSYRRFPDDQEFRQSLGVKDVYHFRNHAYLLEKLENEAHAKEPVDVEGYTIEHIMPQNPDLSPAWREELGPNWKQLQNKYLHTLGNLTLTGYNSEYQDKPFLEKRDMKNGFRDSPIGLNKSLARLEYWNEDEITKRAESLANVAVKVWGKPSLSGDVLAVYGKAESEAEIQEPTAEDIEDRFKGDRLELFQLLRERILSLDPTMREDWKRVYVAYKTQTNIVDVMPRQRGLRLVLNMPFARLTDPQHLCEDITGTGHWGNGDVKFHFVSPDQIEYAISLIRQSIQYNRKSAT